MINYIKKLFVSTILIKKSNIFHALKKYMTSKEIPPINFFFFFLKKNFVYIY
jgi:hypothetical protein